MAPFLLQGKGATYLKLLKKLIIIYAYKFLSSFHVTHIVLIMNFYLLFLIHSL